MEKKILKILQKNLYFEKILMRAILLTLKQAKHGLQLKSLSHIRLNILLSIFVIPLKILRTMQTH